MISISLLLLLASCCLTALAHEPLTIGTSAGPDWATWQSSLLIPNNKFTFAGRRYSSAAGPMYWLHYNATKGDELYLWAGTGSSLATRGLRVRVYAFGPGLSKKYSRGDFRVSVPTGSGFRYTRWRSPDNLNTCKWLTTTYAKESYNVTTYNGVSRCGTAINPVNGQGTFPMLDAVFKAPRTAKYYFVFHLTQLVNAGWSINTGFLGHAHPEGDVVLPTPPQGNAQEINPRDPNATVTNAIFGLNRIQSFSIEN